MKASLRRTLPAFAALAAALALTVLSGGCRSTDISVKKAGNDELAQYGDVFGTPHCFNRRTGNMLADLLLENTPPEQTVRALLEHYRRTGNEQILAVLADFCLVTGWKSSDETLAARYFLSSMLAANRYLAGTKDRDMPFSFDRIEQIWIYNQSLSRFFLYLRKKGIADNGGYNFFTIGGLRVEFRMPEYHLPFKRSDYSEFSLCGSFVTENLRLDSFSFGIGCPVVTETVTEQPYFPVGSLQPASMVLLFRKGETADSCSAGLVYFDPYKTSSAGLETGTGEELKVPLAMDFSTPTALQAAKPLKFGNLFYMLRPDKTGSQAGLYMLEPFREDKIPVVMVHGLMSSLYTWLQMINTLKSDPEIRNNYQFWGYTYSSGNPVLMSAADMREQLLAVRKRLKAADVGMDKFDRMVLIGHSMGGLLSKTMIMSPEEKIYRDFFKSSRAEVLKEVGKNDMAEKLDRMISFSALPFVSRVIFIAVPHRGSNLAHSPVAKLGISLTRFSEAVIKDVKDIFGRVAFMLSRDGHRIKKKDLYLHTGIDNLDPRDPVLNILNEMPLEKPYNSIIGNRAAAGVPGGTDGVVDYSSAHLDGADSELIVKSSHSVQQQVLAINEVHRILRKHLRETEKNSGKTEAEK